LMHMAREVSEGGLDRRSGFAEAIAGSSCLTAFHPTQTLLFCTLADLVVCMGYQCSTQSCL
jgi:hypothetical protein